MKPTLKYLKWWDIPILTILMFGTAIFSSMQVFFTTSGAGDSELTQPDTLQNLYMLLFEGVTLAIALAYLAWRRFDFKQWHFAPTVKATVTAIGLFVFLAFSVDVFFILLSPGYAGQIFGTPWDIPAGLVAFFSQFTNISMVALALLNGCYEEIYFIGMCSVVEKRYRPWIFVLSLLVRISFHTYQGVLAALAIGLILGIFYRFWYEKKDNNLYPIFLSHAIADVVGLGIFQYLIIAASM
ncbi:CPBP family glutamic-type intramembrane protease [Streptococcus caprae]|uniref:Type II CAAX prenyl endopeptidase Rce1 family protein n=1 Tax=Streptococcus caprae TaxID=1640501 RepID=A0ABV8CW38_9STRE